VVSATKKHQRNLPSQFLHINKNQRHISHEFVTVHIYCKLAHHPFVVRMRATIKPYNPSTSAKIRIRIMPTKSRGCCAVPLTPASPTTPMAKPAASPDRPTLSPAPSCRKDLCTATCQLQHTQWQYFGHKKWQNFLTFYWLADLILYFNWHIQRQLSYDQQVKLKDGLLMPQHRHGCFCHLDGLLDL